MLTDSEEEKSEIATDVEHKSKPVPEPRRLRVIILAYCISPSRGSEYSVAWNHVWHMSHHCDLTVLYGAAGPHMGDLEEIEENPRVLAEMRTVRFVPVKPSFVARIFNYPNKKGVFPYCFYLAYKVWHLQAARRARDLISEEGFDLVHYLGPIGYREPGYLWKLDKPYLWGPVGGMPSARVLKGMPRPITTIFKSRLKNLVNAFQLRGGRRLSHAFARADNIIAATTENAKIMKSRFNVDARHIPENAIPADWIRRADAGSYVSGPLLNLIWVGRLDNNKSPDLLVDALSKIAGQAWHLDLVGEGQMGATLQAKIARLGFENQVTFRGQLPRAKVMELFNKSDLHVLTSLSEANTTVLFEAMAARVPTISLDHCGMHDTICNKCGVLIPITDFAGTSDSIAKAIGHLIDNPRDLCQLRRGTLDCQKGHMWDRRSKLWLSVYHQTISKRQETKGDAPIIAKSNSFRIS